MVQFIWLFSFILCFFFAEAYVEYIFVTRPSQKFLSVPSLPKESSHCGFLSFRIRTYNSHCVVSLCIPTYRAEIERGEIFWMWGRTLRNSLLSLNPARKWNGIGITVFIAHEPMLIKLHTFIRSYVGRSIMDLDTLHRHIYRIKFKF